MIVTVYITFFPKYFVNQQKIPYSASMKNVTCCNSTVNGTTMPASAGEELTWDDATWILTSSFIIFTMQSGKF